MFTEPIVQFVPSVAKVDWIMLLASSCIDHVISFAVGAIFDFDCYILLGVANGMLMAYL